MGSSFSNESFIFQAVKVEINNKKRLNKIGDPTSLPAIGGTMGNAVGG
jgi:hypothetical protein